LCLGGSRWRACRRAALAARGAAVLGKISNKTVHHIEVRTIDELSAESLLSNQSRTLKILQMEGQRGRQQANALADEAGGHSFWALLNQQPIDREPMFMSECT
jgi:hypothetical protein